MHEPRDSQNAAPSSSCPVLVAMALSCERDERRLFSGVSVRLSAGSMLRLRGPNGSGKSSLLRLLCGLGRPDAGHVELFGQPLARQRGALAARLLWIGHAAGIKAALTAEENLAWLGALHGHGATTASRRALAAVGLCGFEDTPCHALSAGQRRRIALARLYLPDAPALWLLDEPFTALDAAGTEQLEAHLATHCEQGGTVVLSAHHELTRRAQVYGELDLGLYAT